ncbi:hypothetical protein [Absidia glauca]|uniref:Uncharacterized protein n=1 Tax=Absidia glauca TaxID=4829 RepID=A0A168R3V2_ABSGL|nr:hypothetical protein [Absidia glauca]
MDSINNHTLHAFGFNAYGQISQQPLTKVQDTHRTVTRVLMAAWESTFVLTKQGVIELWGYSNAQHEELVAHWNNKELMGNKKIRCIFGDLQLGLGTIDDAGNVLWWGLGRKSVLLGNNIKDAGFCAGLNGLFLLSVDGKVTQYERDQWDHPKVLDIPTVESMAVSTTHVLFGVNGSAPVFGLGSNRMGQLGMDTSTTQHVDQPTRVDFFDGLGMMGAGSSGVKVACGSFHSAVVLHNDLYTFGWNDRGMIGWGTLTGQEEHDDSASLLDSSGIRLASFAGDGGQEADVSVDQVACGTAHTVAIDVSGSAWTCGSDKYSQLGRSLTTTDDYDDCFRRCSTINGKVTDSQAGPWCTFLQT